MKTSRPFLTRDLRLVFPLSLVVGLLMAGVSLAGLLFQGEIFPTVELSDSFLANEVVNLIIGLPILLGSVWLAGYGNLLGFLLLPGALLYIFYNYIAYLIGVPLSPISFVYLVIVLLSGYAIIDLLRHIDGGAVRERLSGAVPAKLSGWVLVVLGFLFILLAFGMLIQAHLNRITLPMSDLGVLIGDILLSAIWVAGGVLLLLRKPLGYTSGLGLLFAGSMLFVALLVFLLLGPALTEAAFVPTDFIVVLLMGMCCFIPFFLFMRGMFRERK